MKRLIVGRYSSSNNRTPTDIDISHKKETAQMEQAQPEMLPGAKG